MEESKKKKRRSILITGILLLLTALLVLIPFLLDARQQNLKSEGSILSARVERGTIRKTLSGTGTLTEQDAQEVSVPADVEVTEYLVVNGQVVSEGDAVAAVDKVSVMEAVSNLREAMNEVETEMEQLRSGSDYSYVSAPASGRIKAVYAQTGDAVREVILEHGALAVLSLDGMMATAFPAGAGLGIGQTVNVVLSDGTETAGRIETIIDGTATVTLPDSCGRIGETVRILNRDGEVLGSGMLYVHSPWKALATEGTVGDIYVQEEQTVSAYGTLMVLSGATTGGSYERLVSEHQEYEDLMAELFRMYQDGVLRAPCDGCVSGVDDDILKLLSADGASAPGLKLLANAPEGDPDGSFTNVIGIVTDLSGTAFLQSWQTEIEDYADTAFAVTATESFTKKVSLRFPTAYQLKNEAYSYLKLTEAEAEKETDDESERYFVPAGTYYTEDGNTYTEISFPKETEVLLRDGYLVLKETGQILCTRVENTNRWSEAGISVGGIYIFAFDRSDQLVFMVWLGNGEVPAADDESHDGKNGGSSPGGSAGGNGGGNAGGSGGSGDSASGYGSGTAGSDGKKAETRYSTDGTTILSVTPQETVSVSITIDELDILLVRKGQDAMVTLDALQGRAFSGVITEVNTTASNEGGNSKYSAVVEMPREDSMLGGMNASANITLEEREDVLLIPAAALAEENGACLVYRTYDNQTERLADPAPVETGLSDGNQVQILSGLQEGDTVWYRYYDTLEIKGLTDGVPSR